MGVKEIQIHSFGEIKRTILEAVRCKIERRFGLLTAHGETLVVPIQAFSRRRDQYRSTVLLDVLRDLQRNQRSKFVRLGITSVVGCTHATVISKMVDLPL